MILSGRHQFGTEDFAQKYANKWFIFCAHNATEPGCFMLIRRWLIDQMEFSEFPHLQFPNRAWIFCPSLLVFHFISIILQFSFPLLPYNIHFYAKSVNCHKVLNELIAFIRDYDTGASLTHFEMAPALYRKYAFCIEIISRWDERRCMRNMRHQWKEQH